MASYLLPGVMHRRLITIIERYHWDLGIENVESGHQKYQQAIQQYFGLGGLLQLIPGSLAFRARQEFSNELEPLLQAGRNCLYQACIADGPQFMVSERQKEKGLAQELHSLINLSPGYFFFSEFLLSFRAHEDVIHGTYPFQRILCQFPIVRDCLFYIRGEFRLKENIGELLFKSLRNPFKIVDDLLEFLHISLHRLCELGDKPHHGSSSSLLREGMKALVSIPFALMRAPVKIGKFILDGAFQIIKNLSYAPLRHFYLSCRPQQNQTIKRPSIDSESTQDMLQKFYDNETPFSSEASPANESSPSFNPLFQQQHQRQLEKETNQQGFSMQP